MKLLVKKIKSFVSNERLIELTQQEFNQNIITYFCYSNETPIIKITDDNSLFIINNLNEKLTFFNSSEMLITIVEDDLISLSSSSSTTSSDNKLVATLTQSSTVNPSINVIVDNLNDNTFVSIARTETGRYLLTIQNTTGPNNVSVQIENTICAEGGLVSITYFGTYSLSGFNFHEFQIITTLFEVQSDDVLLNTPITIYSI
jgi:hypothetical protein